jgi:hypothetical protein
VEFARTREFSVAVEEHKKSHAFQQHDPGDEGRDRRNLPARHAVPVAPARAGQASGGGGAGRRCSAAKLLGGAATGAPAGGAGQDRGGGGKVAGPPGRGGVRRRLPELEGRR